jgi:hypothetical protein
MADTPNVVGGLRLLRAAAGHGDLYSDEWLALADDEHTDLRAAVIGLCVIALYLAGGSGRDPWAAIAAAERDFSHAMT